MYANCSSMPEKMNNSKGKPLVTAIVTTYNRPQMVQRAIQSGLAQTYDPLEIIIVEDGSCCGVEGWLDTQGLSQIRYIRHEENQGLPAARNTGLNNSNGKYIAYLDDDDEWKPEKIQKQIELAERLDSDYAIIYCGLEVKDQDGRIVALNMPRLKGTIRDEIVKKGLNTIPSSFLFRKETLMNIAGFDTDLYTGIDHDIWMKLSKYGYKTDYVNEPLVIHTQHDELQMTSNVPRRISGIEEYLNKWRPDILSWFGPKAGEKYCSDYYVKVIGGLGLSLVLNGAAREGKKILWNVFLKEPMDFLSNPRLILAFWGGKKVYELLVMLKSCRILNKWSVK